MNRFEDICANAGEAIQSERKGQRMIFPGMWIWIWIWSITFDCILKMTIYLCVINMMFALLYENNLDYAEARGPKSLNFPDRNFQRAKTFRTKCVNRFRDKKSA